MILPLRLVWNLRVSPQEKAGIIATFGVASLCVIAAMLRVISVGSKSGISTPSSSWLALWGMIEGCIGTIAFLQLAPHFDFSLMFHQPL